MADGILTAPKGKEALVPSSSAGPDPQGQTPGRGGHKCVWRGLSGLDTAAVSVTEMPSVMSRPVAARMLGCLDRNDYFLTLLSLCLARVTPLETS